MIFRSILVALCAWALPCQLSVGAQACVTLQDAIRLSEMIDPSIGEADARIAGAKARLTGVKSHWRPQISGFAQTNDGPNGIGDGRTNNQLGITVSQRLFDFGRGRFEQRSAEARVSVADFGLHSAKNDVATLTAQTYLGALKAEERVRAAKMRKAYLTDLVAGLDARLSAKDITTAEKSRIEAEFALAGSDLIEEELALAAAQSDFFILTGSDRAICQNLAQIDAYFARSLPATLVDIIDLATSRHPEILAAEAERTALRADVRAVSRNRAPTVDLQGVAAVANENFSDQFDVESRIGINVNAPIYGFGRYSSEKREIAAELQVVELSVARLRRDLEKRITLTWKRASAYQALALSQASARESLKAEAAALVREFENGLRPYQDVLQAEAGVQNAILQEIEARYLGREQNLQLVSLVNALNR